jgi:hypothetical protein
MSLVDLKKAFLDGASGMMQWVGCVLCARHDSVCTGISSQTLRGRERLPYKARGLLPVSDFIATVQ